MRKYNLSEDFINDRIKDICSPEMSSTEKVIYFLSRFFTVYVFSLAFLALK